MIHKFVGHFRVAIAVFQVGLPLKAFSYEPNTEDLSYSERAKCDIHLMIDFVIQIGAAERKHRATDEYIMAYTHMGSYKQPSGSPSNNKTRKKLWWELNIAEKLQERRDWYGLDSLEDREQRILQDYETGSLRQQLRQLRSGCMPRPLFFRVQS